MAAAEPREAMIIDDDGVVEYGAESAPRGGPGSAIRVVRPYRNQPDRMVGKIFGSDSQGDYHCSGAVVQAGNRSVVMTAGHCVFNTNTGQWANRVVFVPAYGSSGQGTRPYGLWSDYNLWSHIEWTQYGNYEVDVGAVVIQPRNGQRIQNVVGAHRIGVGQPVSGAFRPWGYPAQAPFTGWDQWYCAAPVAGRDVDDGYGPPTIGVRCNLTPGSSGGPWLRAIAANGIGTVLGDLLPIHGLGDPLRAVLRSDGSSGVHRRLLRPLRRQPEPARKEA